MSTGPVIPCLALLRVGVTEPPESPRTLVRSYRTVSPLPVLRCHSHRRSALCCPNRQVAPSWLSPAPCPVESRLSSTSARGRGPVPRPPSRLTVTRKCTRRRIRPPIVLAEPPFSWLSQHDGRSERRCDGSATVLRGSASNER